MVSTSTLLSVLALVVAAYAAVGWRIYLTRVSKIEAAIGRLNASFLQQRTSITALEKQHDRSDSAKLATAVADLAGAVEGHANSNRRQFGKLWQALAAAEKADDEQPDLPLENETPEQTRARLRQQHGLPKVGPLVNRESME